MITYLIQVVLFQIAFLAVYDFLLSKETFHTNNRWYLLGTPIVSFVLPLVRIPTLQKAVPEELMVYLPEVVLSPQKVIEQSVYYSESSINYVLLMFWIGAAIFFIIFLVKLYRIVSLIYRNEMINKKDYKLVLLPKKSIAFSFFKYIFLGKAIPTEKQKDIIKHELIHAEQQHSLDLLFFEILRVVMWFNPMVYIYQQRITLLHEYISDAEVVKTTHKKDYFNKLLSQTFEVENISFVNQFYKHSFIKKRITMMTKNKSKQVKKTKYLLLLPMLVGMLLYTSCNSNGSTNSKDQEIAELKQQVKDLEKQYFLEKQMKSYLLRKSDSLIKDKENVLPNGVDQLPVFTIDEANLNGRKSSGSSNDFHKQVRGFIMKNFNAGLAKEIGLSKGSQKIWTVFIINESGKVTNVKVRAAHPKLKEEALRVIYLLPKMKPAMKEGKPVSMKYTVPISFKVE